MAIVTMTIVLNRDDVLQDSTLASSCQDGVYYGVLSEPYQSYMFVEHTNTMEIYFNNQSVSQSVNQSINQ